MGLTWNATVEAIKEYAYPLADMCLPFRKAVREHAQQPWLHVTDCLIELTRCESDSAVQLEPDNCERLAVWREFGRRIGIDETQLRREAATLQGKMIAGSPGCSWVRCPLNQTDEGVVGREILACSRCHAVRIVLWPNDLDVSLTEIGRSNTAENLVKSSTLSRNWRLWHFMLNGFGKGLAGRGSQADLPSMNDEIPAQCDRNESLESL